MLCSDNFGDVTRKFRVVFPWCSVLHIDVGGSAWDSLTRGCDSSVWQGTTPPPPPFQATTLRTPPRSLHSCFPFKSIQAAEAKGHPVLPASSCSTGSRIGQSGAFSHLPALNTGGHGSLGKVHSHCLEVATIVCLSSFNAQNSSASCMCGLVCIQWSWKISHGRKPFESAPLV